MVPQAWSVVALKIAKRCKFLPKALVCQDACLRKTPYCCKPPSYVPYKGTYVLYNGTFGAPDQGQTLDM